jgi:hypothetical protein
VHDRGASSQSRTAWAKDQGDKGSHGQCGWEIDTDFAIVHGVMEKKRSGRFDSRIALFCLICDLHREFFVVQTLLIMDFLISSSKTRSAHTTEYRLRSMI